MTGQPGKPRPIGTLLDELSSQMQLQAGIRSARLPDIWSEVAGPRISAVSRPLKLERGKLFVRVDNSVWRQEITLLRRELLQRLRDRMSDQHIEELVLL